MRFIKGILFLLILISWQNSYCQLIHDESYSDQSFSDFKIKLSQVIQTKDLQALKTLVSDTIYESNDGCGFPGCSKSEFFKYYFLNEKSENWETLKRIVRFGFYEIPAKSEDIIQKGSKAFFGPSYFMNFNDTSELIVIAENVAIRESASANSKILTYTSFQKFKCDCSINSMTEETYIYHKDGINWVQVYLENGKEGYVAIKYTSISISKRLIVQKINGEWKITHFYHPPGC